MDIFFHQGSEMEVYMVQIRDDNNHLVCKANEETGYIEAAYKGQVVSTYLPVGKSLRIERQGAITIITRDTETTIKIERCTAA